MYDSLYRLATRSTPPQLTQHTVKTRTSIYQPRPTSATRNNSLAAFNDLTDLRFQQRSSSCIQQLDRPQLPAMIIQLHPTTRPTLATSNNHLAASLWLDHTSYQHHPSSWRHSYYYHKLYTMLVNTAINCHLGYICYLAFVSFIVFGCHYSHA